MTARDEYGNRIDLQKPGAATEVAAAIIAKLLGEKFDSLEDAIQHFTYAALDHVNAEDWYNNDGGDGTLLPRGVRPRGAG